MKTPLCRDRARLDRIFDGGRDVPTTLRGYGPISDYGQPFSVDYDDDIHDLLGTLVGAVCLMVMMMAAVVGVLIWRRR